MEEVAPAEDLKFGLRLAISRVNRDGSFRSRLLVWRADAAAEIGGPPLYVPAKHSIMLGNKQRCFGVRAPLRTISPIHNSTAKHSTISGGLVITDCRRERADEEEKDFDVVFGRF
jgi:hypothetical protein